MRPQIQCRQTRGIAGDKGLSRRGTLAGVLSDIGIGGALIDQCDRHAEGIGGNLRHDRIGTLTDIDRAVIQHEAAVVAQSDCHGRWIGDHRIADAVPHTSDAHAAALVDAIKRLVDAIKRRARRTHLLPCWPQCQQALAQSHTSTH